MVVLPLAGLIALPFGATGIGVAIAFRCLALTSGLVALAVVLLGRSWGRQLRRMEAGEHELYWRYTAQVWAPFRERQHKEAHRLTWIIPLALSGSGLMFAVWSSTTASSPDGSSPPEWSLCRSLPTGGSRRRAW